MQSTLFRQAFASWSHQSTSMAVAATTTSVAVSASLSRLFVIANPMYHDAKVDPGDEDVDGEDLLQRFNWQVSHTGVMEEIRRGQRHEDARDKRKRMAQSVARRFHHRCVLH